MVDRISSLLVPPNASCPGAHVSMFSTFYVSPLKKGNYIFVILPYLFIWYLIAFIIFI